MEDPVSAEATVTVACSVVCAALGKIRYLCNELTLTMLMIVFAGETLL